MYQKSVFISVAAAVLAVCFIFGVAGAASPLKTKLPAVYQKWLDEEVVYIISSLERDVFLKLQSDRERDLFIETFWKRRDPVPVTPENEFKIEHERRLAYANKYYGRTVPKPGWKTDRGRMYIILGEPNDIAHYYGKTGIYDTEVWFYQEKDETKMLGLPPGFNLVFFQEGSVGDFKLYSPTQDGPMAILQDYRGDPRDYEKAYKNLQEIDFNLASASMSLIPGETYGASGRPLMTSDILLQKIETSAADRVDDKYAAKFLEYKDIVEVEYSTNYLDSDGSMIVLRDPSGLYFVHYAIEPARLSIASVGLEYATMLRLNGSVSSADGRPVYQFEKTVGVRMDESQKNELGRMPFMVQDLFPLIPGTYKVSILLKNEASKEFCSFERTVVVPGPDSGIGITAPLLGYRTQPADPERHNLKPFRFGATLVYFQPNRTLTKSDQIVLAFQALGLDETSLRKARLRFEITRDAAPVKDWERDLSGCPDLPFVVESIPADDLAPALYTVKIRLLVDGREIAASGEEFALTPLETVPRPWIRAKLMPDGGDPSYDGILGRQFEAAGRPAEARVLLEKANAEGLTLPDNILALARVYFQAGEYPAAASLLNPFLSEGAEAVYEIWILAAESRLKAEDFAGAVDVLDRAMARFGVNPVLLNLLGDGYLGLNRPADARAAWERSLGLNSDQPDLRKKLDALKSRAPVSDVD
ncbi:MAG: GWxTD domain-containing protein [Candidatus Aminicenantes bacterium]|nr:GWxTD domain-containing protein [Candidatus Aminicenantes bacterium]